MSLPDAAAAAGSWSPFRWVVTVVVVLVATLIAWTIVEARSVQVSRATITSPNLPTEFDGKLVLFVADIHAGPYLGKRRMRAIVDRINALEPDIIVLGGDYVGGRAGGKAVFYPEIKHLNAPLGAYAVLGNHDYWEGVEEAKAGLAAAGVTLLLNDNVPLTLDGASIRLAGVDDPRIGTADAAAAAAGIVPEDFAIFATHNPDYLPEALPDLEGAFDLALAGHTHSGQLTAFGMIAPFVPSAYGQRYKGGWSDEYGAHVLVTRGVGSVTVPMRLFAPPEIHVIELRRGPRGIAY